MAEEEKSESKEESEDENFSSCTKQDIIIDSTIKYIDCKVEGCNRRYTQV